MNTSLMERTNNNNKNMKYRIDKDELEDFELTVLEYVKDSVPHTEENGYIVFDEDTYNKIDSIENINDGIIREITWNEDNAKFFREHKESIMDYLQWVIKDTEYDSIIELIGYSEYFYRDNITFDDIGNALFNKDLIPDIHSWEFQVQSYVTIFLVETLIFKIKNRSEKYEN